MKNIMTKSIICLAAAATLGCAYADNAKTNNTLSKFTAAQQSQIKKYIDQQMQQYIMDNPKVIMSSVQRLQMQMQAKTMQQSQNAVAAHVAELTSSATSPTVGPKNAPVTFVEFYDYQCSVCHAMYPRVEQLMKNNPKIRFVFKEFPIFGPASQFAAKAAIAAEKQGKFMALHKALFQSNKMEGKLTNQDVLDMAKKAGIDTDKLQKDMKDPAIQTEINDNYALAKKIKLQGTPAFIVSPTVKQGDSAAAQKAAGKIGFAPGGATIPQLQAFIDKAKN